MAKIIVAFAEQAGCARCASVLEAAGMPVFARCTCAAEVKRALDWCGDGVLVCGCRLPDSTVDALAWDLEGRAVIVAVGSPRQLDMCEHPDVFHLRVPCSRGELTAAVDMLLQLHRMRLPRRSQDAQQTIAKAKRFLMETRGMTEPEAHRRLQKGAMDAGAKLEDYAAGILGSNE